VEDGPVTEHRATNVASSAVIGLGLVLIALAGLLRAARWVRAR